MKVLFYGTPAMAVPFLDELVRREKVCGVVTAPDKPSGRGMSLTSPPVAVKARELGIPVFQPNKLKKNQKVLDDLHVLKPDLGIVVAYGKFLPRDIFDLPRWRTFNVHFSLLPRCRGAAPVAWTLIRGEQESGVSTFWIEEGMDSGRVILRMKIPILDEDNEATLTKNLIGLGLKAMGKTIAKIKETPDFPGKSQGGDPTFAPSLSRQDARIDWGKSGKEISDLVRGVCVWPIAWTVVEGQRLKVFSGKVVGCDVQTAQPGKIVKLEHEQGFVVKCREDGFLVLAVQPEGKKKMGAWSYWQGAKLSLGATLGDK